MAGWLPRPRLDPRGCWAWAKLPDVVNGYKWELYNVADDYSENNDLAATMPDKLREMQELFVVEAAKYQVFPLDNSHSSSAFSLREPSPTAGRTVFTYSGELTGMPKGNAPNILGKSLLHHGRRRHSAGGCRGDDQYPWWPLRRLRALLGQGQAGLYLCQFPRFERFRWEGQRHSRPASIPSCLTSSTTVPVWARAAPACCRWMARKSPARRSRTPFRSS